MLRARYSWRPLGALLVEKRLLTEQELEAALAEQRRTGRLVGQILVERGSLSAFALARALSEQHGVELQTEAQLDAKVSRTPAWRPLGRLLVEEGYLTRAELRKALGRSARAAAAGSSARSSSRTASSPASRSPGRSPSRTASSSVPTATSRCRPSCSAAAPTQVTYQVCEIGYDPRHRARDVIYESASFLEAVDFAGEYVEEVDPDAIEIHRVDRRGPRDRLDVQRQPRRRDRGVEEGPRGDVRLRPHALGRSPRLAHFVRGSRDLPHRPILGRCAVFPARCAVRVGRGAPACGQPGLLT